MAQTPRTSPVNGTAQVFHTPAPKVTPPAAGPRYSTLRQLIFELQNTDPDGTLKAQLKALLE